MSDASAPLAMRPNGFAGRLFGIAMEWMNAPAYRLAIEMLAPERQERVLEIGFGTGRLIELVLERVPEGAVAGIDPTPTMLDVARNRRAVRLAAGRADLRLGDVQSLPWDDQRFDACAALHCFQFWVDPDAALHEVRRVLRPGGRLALVLRRHHPRRPPAWLPNPISRRGDEVAGVLECLRARGFACVEPALSRWPAYAILARRS